MLLFPAEVRKAWPPRLQPGGAEEVEEWGEVAEEGPVSQPGRPQEERKGFEEHSLKLKL